MTTKATTTKIEVTPNEVLLLQVLLRSSNRAISCGLRRGEYKGDSKLDVEYDLKLGESILEKLRA